MVIKNTALKYIDDVYPFDGRIMGMTLRNHGPKIHIVNAYAPTAAACGRAKEDFWRSLDGMVSMRNTSHITIIGGDWNTKLKGRTSNSDLTQPELQRAQQTRKRIGADLWNSVKRTGFAYPLRG